jgi:hypothetical protein
MSYSNHEDLLNNSVDVFNVDRFNMYYLDEIIELVFHLQDSFYNPFLSDITTQKLIELLILFDTNNSKDILNYLNSVNKIDFNLFYDEFENEINISFNLICRFLKKIKCKPDIKLWSFFCFKNTEINYI